ncbi:MAG: HAD-IIA family hydrolase [Victivallaceae bacterium]|nr:HAD hydrolase-like protein [Victivallaceae bacterium]
MNFLDFWRERRREFDAVFLDIDGTVISGRKSLPRAAEMLESFDREGVPYLFLTNDANHSPEQKAAIVRRAGLAVAASKIVSAGSALSNWAAESGETGKTYFMMGDLGTPCYAAAAGIVTVNDPAKLDSCAGVLVGEDYYDWYEVFFEVFNFFQRRPDAKLVSPSPDICWAGWKRDGFGLGAGAVAEALQLWLHHQNIELPIVFLGKPHHSIFECALLRLGLSDPSRVIMLGDSLRGDVVGANRCGVTSGLLLTGITDRKAASAARGERRPQFVFEGL